LLFSLVTRPNRSNLVGVVPAPFQGLRKPLLAVLHVFLVLGLSPTFSAQVGATPEQNRASLVDVVSLSASVSESSVKPHVGKASDHDQMIGTIAMLHSAQVMQLAPLRDRTVHFLPDGTMDILAVEAAISIWCIPKSEPNPARGHWTHSITVPT
jgi:hypothetical protein